MGVFPYGPRFWGTQRDALFLWVGAIEIKRYIKTDVNIPRRRVSSSIGALLGNLEGIRLPGLFERKG